MNDEQAARCNGVAADGEPCRKRPRAGTAWCPAHDPDRTSRPRAKARDFGRVRQLKSGNWQASYLHEGRRYVAPTTYKSKGSATAWLAAMRADIERGAWLDPAGGRQTFEMYATNWLAARPESDVRPTTRAKYGHLLRRHLFPAFGSSLLAQIKPSAVRSWYLELQARHPTTADDAYRLLRALMNTALSDRLIGSSPCTVKGAGQVHSAKRPVASVAEVTGAVEAIPERQRLAVLLPAWCQLRRGEVLGLQRRDVDLLHGTIRVERAWTKPMNGPLTLGDPKTEAGKRKLAVPGNVMAAVREHLDRWVGPEPEAWLFAGDDGRPIDPTTINRIWARARKTIGRPDLHLHDLRHSGLTWSAASGASLAELMRRGGHKSPAAALRYQHDTDERDRALADALEALSQPVSQIRREHIESTLAADAPPA